MVKRTWSNQFTINEDRPLTIPAWLLKRLWEDLSWGNEVCPRFVNYDLAVALWVDYDNPEDREITISTWKKFNLVRILNIDEDILADEVLFSTDDDLELQKFLHSYAITMHSTQIFNSLTALLDLCTSDKETELVQSMLDDIVVIIPK